VNWPTKAGEPVSAGILLNYHGWDDRAAEQTVFLTGTPAKVGGWLWRVSCPKRGNRSQRFIWRQTATVGDRPERPARP